ncbi:hypothetical protein V8E54_006048 [Elaphomyces granulatus]
MVDQSPAIPANDPIVEPQGRLALAQFPNNIVNVNPSDYIWVRNFSNYLLCHRTSETAAPPRRALFWIVGDLEKVSLSTAGPYSSWFVDICLPPPANKALSSINVLDDIASDEEDDALSSVDDRSPFPFTYDGRTLTATGASPPFGYDVSKFDDQSTVAVEVALLGYQLADKDPGYSVGMQGIYHLGAVASGTSTSPGKRKGGCLLSPRRQRGAPFVTDPSRPL